MSAPIIEPLGMSSGPMPTPEERNWGMLAHISGLIAIWLGGFALLGPLIVWLLKKDQSPFVGDQAKEALNSQIAVTIATWISGALVCVFFIGLVLLAIVYVGSIVFSIIAALEASKGVYYRYPYTLRLIS